MDNRCTEPTNSKYFKDTSEDYIIEKCSNPSKENEKWLKQVRFNERGNHVSQKECDKGKNKNDQNIYASTARMSDNYEYPSRDLGDSSHLTK